ncbi:T-lymphocyte activation antigen CD80-like [Plectropomus leopardus]|uniref:T-lymphocyte activation antigen CD80-like n=1 Tax=Plectropomus leopardus TaxID=160734 RepID=UPI001C4BA699|nr:T-lymphocyte activation antigen CD80-like [Plectropomus leopardus]
MPAALWRAGLLLSFLGFCACLEDQCVLGVVGRPVSLPCVYPQLLSSENISIEWRRGEEVVLTSVVKEDGDVEEWSVNRATTPADAALTGNFSLQLPTVDPSKQQINYSLFVNSGENQSTELCTVCLRTAASFSFPRLQKEAEDGEETTFLCQSSGGFPEPAVYWLINNTEEPPEGSVMTKVAPLPNTNLYNVTSLLTVNVSKDDSVSCVIQNLSMNETLSSTTYGGKGSPVKSRASEAMWMFSTGLCVVVGVMVLAGVMYQIHLDRISKKKKKEFQKEQEQTKRGERLTNLTPPTFTRVSEFLQKLLRGY